MVALIISVVCGVLGLIVAAIMAAWVLKQDEGSKTVKDNLGSRQRRRHCFSQAGIHIPGYFCSSGRDYPGSST